MEFRIAGVDRKTGQDIQIIIEACDESEAATIAYQRNLLVYKISEYKEPRSFEHMRPAATQGEREVKQCSKCKEWIDKDATKCPHCRSRQPAPPWAVVVAILLVALPALCCCGPCSPSATSSKSQSYERKSKSNERKLHTLFDGYVGSRELPEVSWIEVEDNNIYVGFDRVPDNLTQILRGWALAANDAINFGAHVWAVPAEKRGWRPGKGPYYAQVTARYGRIQD